MERGETEGDGGSRDRGRRDKRERGKERGEEGGIGRDSKMVKREEGDGCTV